MFKKNLWIAGLIAVLAIMFIGCVDEYVPPAPEGEIVTVLDMQDVLKDAPIGALTNAKFSEVFDGTPFKPAGGIPNDVGIEIIDAGGGKKGLKVSPLSSWGAGIDIRDIATADGNTGVDYHIEDTIYIKGKGAASFQLCHGGGAYAFFDWHPAGVDFEETFTMTKKEVDDAKLAVPPNRPATIRLNNDGTGRTEVFTITDLVIKGYRKSGEAPPPPPPPPNFDIPGSGYTPPAASTLQYNEFYLDLNKAQYSKLNGDDHPTGTISATKLSVTFNKNPQAIYIPFNDSLKNLIKSAAAAGYKITVTINATLPTGMTAYRSSITNGETSNWATSNRVSNSLTGDFTNLSDQNSDPNGFLFQQQTAPASFTGAVEITSIKFAFVGNAVIPGAISDTEIKIAFPLAGWAPNPAITNGDVTGSVKFIPEPIFGKFGRSTVYYAEITVTPKAGIYIPAATVFTVKDSSGFAAVPTVTVNNYDPIKGVVLTAAFPATDATDVPNPVEGANDGDHGTFTQETGSTIKWQFSNYISTNYAAAVTGSVVVKAGEFIAPIVDSGASKYEFLNNGLNITQGSDAYKSIDINLIGDNSLNLDPTTKSYKITVWGNLNGLPAASVSPVIHIPYRGGTVWNSANIIASPPALTTLFAKFEVSANITPTTWAAWVAEDAPNTNDAGKSINRFRIRLSDGAGGTTPFRVCRITIEELP